MNFGQGCSNHDLQFNFAARISHFQSRLFGSEFLHLPILSVTVSKFLNPQIGNIAAIWGLVGSCSILGMAIMRMVGHVREGFEYTLGWQHYALLVPWLFFMLYSEGYKGFQKGYSPRVAARAHYLKEHSTLVRAIFAPIFCMGFFHSTKKRKIVISILVVAITCLVIAFQYVPQPWRGILDVGVVLGLSWGVIATLCFAFKYWFVDASEADPEMPTIQARSPSE